MIIRIHYMCIYITLREIYLVATRESTRYNEVAQNKPSYQITPFSTTLTTTEIEKGTSEIGWLWYIDVSVWFACNNCHQTKSTVSHRRQWMILAKIVDINIIPENVALIHVHSCSSVNGI